MTEQELWAKVREIQTDDLAKMGKDLALYLEQLKPYIDAKMAFDNQPLDEHYIRGMNQSRPEGAGWANYNEPADRNLRAMTQEEVDDFFRRHGKYPGTTEELRCGLFGDLLGLPSPF